MKARSVSVRVNNANEAERFVVASHYRRRVELMEAELGDELVALDVEAGTCFGFNEVATSVWKMLSSPKSFEDIQAGLMQDYDVGADQCETELRELLDDMACRGLIVVQ